MLLKLASEGSLPTSHIRGATVVLRFFSSSTQERQFRDPGECMGPSCFPSSAAGDAARWGQRQSKVSSEPRTCGVTAGRG